MNRAISVAISLVLALTVSAAFAEKGGNRKTEEEFLLKRSYHGAPVPKDAYDKAKAQWDKVPKSFGHKANPFAAKSATTSSTVTSLIGTTWEPVGPSPLQQGSSQVNGRVTSIAVNPNNSNVIYMGAAGGGVWRTIDGGAHWSPLTDQQPSLGTGQASAIAVDPNNTNTIYVGTSNAFLFFFQNIGPQISKC